MPTNAFFQGEQVRFSFLSDTAGTWVAIAVLDINGNMRTIAPYERLIFDRMNCDVHAMGPIFISDSSFHAVGSTTAPSGNEPGIYTVFDDIGDSSFPTPQGPSTADFGEQGTPTVRGSVPVAFLTDSGGNDAFASVYGTGRIVASTQPGRPTWREHLTPGKGNF